MQAVRKQITPYSYQEEILSQIEDHFNAKNSRGKVIMACGTGKSYIAYWAHERLKSQRTLVFVPTLALVHQITADWKRLNPEIQYMAICSDSEAGNESTEATTDIDEIRPFLRDNINCLVFSTYQSTRKLVKCFEKKLDPFDLIIFDEAHRTAGGKNKQVFSLSLKDSNIPSKNRLFLTATPKFVSDEDDGFCMNDQDLYGEVISELPFSEAIEKGLLSDYRLLVSVVDDSEENYLKIIKQNKLINIDSLKIKDFARNVALGQSLLDVISKYKIKKAITFHGTISNAVGFSKTFKKLLGYNSETGIHADVLHSKQKAKTRQQSLDALKKQHVVLSNCRCLTEGIDVPILDSIAYIDPKQSIIDIIQSIGRVLRKKKGKDFGYIIVPIFIKKGENYKDELLRGKNRSLWKLAKILKVMDSVIAKEFKGYKASGRKKGKKISKVIVESAIEVSQDFLEALNIKIVEESTSSFDIMLEVYKKYHKEMFNRTNGFSTYKTPDGVPLGCWVSTWREKIRNQPEGISDEKIEKLLDIGFEIGSSQAELRNRRVKNLLNRGDLKGEDIIKIRKWYAKGFLSKEQIKAIEATLQDWSWESTKTPISDWVEALKKNPGFTRDQFRLYFQEHYKGKDPNGFNSVIRALKKRYKDENKTPEEFKVLSGLSWWSWKNKSEMRKEKISRHVENLKQLQEFTPAECKRVFGCYSNIALGVKQIRKYYKSGDLNEKEIKELEAIKFWSWTPRKNRKK